MRCFLLLTLIGGPVQSGPPVRSYLNRDLMTVVAPMRVPASPDYARARSLIAMNGRGVLYAAETPEEVLTAPCATGAAPDDVAARRPP